MPSAQVEPIEVKSNFPVYMKNGTRHSEMQSAKILKGNVACVVRQFQRLMPCELSDRGNIHFFIP